MFRVCQKLTEKFVLFLTPTSELIIEMAVISVTGILYNIDRLELKNPLRLREWTCRQTAVKGGEGCMEMLLASTVPVTEPALSTESYTVTSLSSSLHAKKEMHLRTVVGFRRLRQWTIYKISSRF